MRPMTAGSSTSRNRQPWALPLGARMAASRIVACTSAGIGSGSRPAWPAGVERFEDVHRPGPYLSVPLLPRAGGGTGGDTARPRRQDSGDHRGASGIGLALARAMAAEGMTVVVADIEEAALTPHRGAGRGRGDGRGRAHRRLDPRLGRRPGRPGRAGLRPGAPPRQQRGVSVHGPVWS